MFFRPTAFTPVQAGCSGFRWRADLRGEFTESYGGGILLHMDKLPDRSGFVNAYANSPTMSAPPSTAEMAGCVPPSRVSQLGPMMRELLIGRGGVSAFR